MNGAEFGMDAGGAFGAFGYIGGISKTVKTRAYMDSVLEFTHSRLSSLFDLWMDNVARSQAREFAHVYEWPSEYQDYNETVGNPRFRLWSHTLTGRGGNKTASFTFLPSVRPSPVNPALLVPGPGGVVKEGVHVFVWKAAAMEYGIDIEVSPKLAKMLAYVDERKSTNGGVDGGFSHKHPREDEDGVTPVRFSEGPVHFTAGGGVHTMKFTSAFIYWWQGQASEAFHEEVRPRLEKDLVDETGLNTAIRTGNRSNKSVKIKAQAGAKTADWIQAGEKAERDLRKVQRNYIEEARARRMMIYGY